MAGQRSFDNWTPAQEQQPETKDFRRLKTGPKGYKEKNKRKMEELEEAAQADVAASAAQDMMVDTEGDMEGLQQSSKRRKAEGKQYIPIYARSAKAPSERASKVMRPAVKTSWEKKMKVKAVQQVFQEQKNAALEAFKEKKKAIGLQKKAARERKEANKAKSVVTQKITNNATLKKMMKNKKQKKLLKKADTN